MAIIYSQQQLRQARNRQTEKYRNSQFVGRGHPGRTDNLFGYIEGNMLYPTNVKKAQAKNKIVESGSHMVMKSRLTVNADVIADGKKRSYPFSKQNDQLKITQIDSEQTYNNHPEIAEMNTAFKKEYTGLLKNVNDSWQAVLGAEIVEIDGRTVGFLHRTAVGIISPNSMKTISRNCPESDWASVGTEMLTVVQEYSQTLSKVYVKPEYRGHGVATRIYQYAQSKGAKLLFIDLEHYLQNPRQFAELYPFLTVHNTLDNADKSLLLILCTEDVIHLNNHFVPNNIQALKQLLNRTYGKKMRRLLCEYRGKHEHFFHTDKNSTEQQQLQNESKKHFVTQCFAVEAIAAACGSALNEKFFVECGFQTAGEFLSLLNSTQVVSTYDKLIGLNTGQKLLQKLFTKWQKSYQNQPASELELA
jgi:GNAT superfamily N-acetyltransferase